MVMVCLTMNSAIVQAEELWSSRFNLSPLLCDKTFRWTLKSRLEMLLFDFLLTTCLSNLYYKKYRANYGRYEPYYGPFEPLGRYGDIYCYKAVVSDISSVPSAVRYLQICGGDTENVDPNGQAEAP